VSEDDLTATVTSLILSSYISHLFSSTRMLKLKMYPARNGDAFLIDASGTHILIDAGFASTYQDFIAADLASIAGGGGRLSLVVCTHIDADHIGGLLELFSLNGRPGGRGIEVDTVWHNSLRSLPFPADPPSSARDQAILEAIRRRGFQGAAATSPNPINARQGSSLAKLLRQNGYAWNAGDGSSSIDDGAQPLALASDLSIQVIGPRYARLEALRALWLRDVQKLGYGGSSQAADLLDDAYEMLCAAAPDPVVPLATPMAAKASRRLAEVYTHDTSISNGSSIALIISSGSTRMLFLGDAWAEDAVSKLKPLRTTSAPVIFDAIKVSHHGSLRNTSVELLSIADSPCFLVSSDGTCHGHPDFEVLAEIVDRPASFKRQLFFNYETAASNQLQAHKSRSGAAFSVHVAEHDWIQIGEASS
jgi:beta-lactamase superfamily II metal-dependent hydrolase